MTDFFTADLHLCHPAVAQMRGFGTAGEHDEQVLSNLERDLSPGDRLFVLGDLSKGSGAPEDQALGMLEVLRLLTGAELHLIAGNHDSASPHRSKWFQAAAAMYPTFASVSGSGTLKIAGTRAMLSHYPYDGDHSAVDRHTQLRLRDEGAPVIHGHTHAREVLSHSAQGTPQVCVSLDAWELRPASKEELEKVLRLAV